MMHQCIKCKEVSQVEGLKVEALQGGIEVNYFECGVCQAKHPAYFTDKETRKMQSDIRKLQARIVKVARKENADPKVIKKFVRQEEVLTIKIRERMDRVRGFVEGVD